MVWKMLRVCITELYERQIETRKLLLVVFADALVHQMMIRKEVCVII